MQSTLMIVVGAIVGWFFDQRANRTPAGSDVQLGVLPASGLIVGRWLESISALVVFSGKDSLPSLVGPAYERAGIIIGGVAFVAIALRCFTLDLRMANPASVAR
jgi:hypothetical protein